MAADGVPPLSPLDGPGFQNIGHRVADLAPGTEAPHLSVPYGLAWLERPNLTKSDPLATGHILALLVW